jgi:hypothetical protein
MLSDYVISLIRTWVPLIIGAVAAWLVARGLNFGPATEAGAITALTGAITGVYYAIVRGLEMKFPFLGFLLGHTAKPHYAKALH